MNLPPPRAASPDYSLPGAAHETSGQKALDPLALLAQLGVSRLHALAAEVIHGETRHDPVLAVAGGDRIRVDDTVGDAVDAVRRHGHADPIARGRAVQPGVQMIDRGRGGRGGRRGATRLDDGRAAL